MPLRTMKLNFSRYDALVLVSLAVFSCYIASSYYFINDVGKNRCSMTYMYEYPQFVKINMADRAVQISRRYALYAYSEGKYIEGARSMKFTGIPVLFVPGHGGSFKQVRSLASVTTHRTLDLQSIFHFDFFTIDFNGELSALYGGTLRDQHEFIILCVNEMLQLYPALNRPKSVVIIGHSMGGMIARSMFMSSYFDPETVKLIITLATPHQPVILIDKDLKNFYWSVDTFWQIEKSKTHSRLENLTMISIGGGSRDILVRPGLTYNKLADLNVLTSAVPDVITSTDHLCIVWCNNFIKTLSRALYDAVDFEIKGITEDREHLRNVFNYHLVHCSNGKYYSPEIHQDRIKFAKNNASWKEIKEPNISLIFEHGVNQDTHIAIKKPKNLVEYDSIMIESVNIDKRDWIFQCNPTFSGNRLTCEYGNNLSQLGTVGFNKTLNRKYLRIGLDAPNVTQVVSSHFVIRLPVTAEETGVNVDIYNKQSRITEVDLSFFQPFQAKTVIESTKRGALIYTLRLNNMVTMWRVYHLYLLPLQCTKDNHAAYAVFKTPWNHDSSHVIVNWEETQVLKLILQTIPPAEIDDIPSVDLILDPSCVYTVKIEPSYLDSVAVIAIRYSLTLIANIAALSMLALASQYLSFGYKESCPSFLNALKRGKGPFFAYPLVKLITYCWSLLKLDSFVGKVDTQLLLEDTADSVVVPLIIYFVSFAILYLVGSCLHHSIHMNVYLYRRYAIGDFLARMSVIHDPYVVNSIQKILPFSLAAIIMIISLVTCGGLGFLVGTILYYIKICCIYKKCLDVTKTSSEKDEEDTSGVILTAADDQSMPKMDSVHLHSSLFLLWSLCSFTYLPSSIMWYRNMGFDSYILQDPSFGFSIVYSCAVGFLWHCNIPYVFLSCYRLLYCVFFKIACVLLLTCQVNIFSLPALLTTVFVSIAAHQYGGLALSTQASSKYCIWKNGNDDTSQVYFYILRFYRCWKRKQN